MEQRRVEMLQFDAIAGQFVSVVFHCVDSRVFD